MSECRQYYWVVICKNSSFHRQDNLFFGHKIPLGEADAFNPSPALSAFLSVRCENCGKEYSYQAKDVLRCELELPESFTPHPLFR